MTLNMQSNQFTNLFCFNVPTYHEAIIKGLHCWQNQLTETCPDSMLKCESATGFYHTDI